MATLTTRNGVHYADFYDANRTPQRKRHSLKTDDKKLARKLLTRLEDAYTLGDYDAWTTAPFDFLVDRVAAPDKLDSAITAFLATKKARPDTIRYYSYTLKRFCRTVGNCKVVAGLTLDDCKRYVLCSEVKETTQRNRHAVLKAFFGWCIREGVIKSSPLVGVELPEVEDEFTRAVSEEELNLIIQTLRKDRKEKGSSADLWCIRLWRFALLTGLRIRDLARLKWKDVDENHRLIYLSAKQKNKKAQTLPIRRSALAILKEIGRGNADEYVFVSPRSRQKTKRHYRYWSESTSKIFSKYRNLAGIGSHVTFHSMRHGFCTTLAENGKTSFIIKAAARHGSVRTSEKYVTIANRHLRQELDDLDD